MKERTFQVRPTRKYELHTFFLRAPWISAILLLIVLEGNGNDFVTLIASPKILVVGYSKYSSQLREENSTHLMLSDIPISIFLYLQSKILGTTTNNNDFWSESYWTDAWIRNGMIP